MEARSFSKLSGGSKNRKPMKRSQSSMKSKKILTFLVGGLAAVSLYLYAGQSAAQKADVGAGKAKYAQLCASCHGASGKGDGPAAGALNPKPRDHSDGKYMKTLKDGDIFKIIKEGGGAVGKSPLMPPWGAALPDQDIRNVVAYIRSLAK
jgi:mono/diheme cytochrome c family protein